MNDDELILVENVKHLNIVAARILVCIIGVPVAFILLTMAGLFEISYRFSFLFLIISSVIYAIDLILIYSKKTQKIATYFGLISINLIVCLMGVNPRVGIYISYSIIPFIGCLYFDVTLTKITTVVSYILMLVSLWFRSQTIYLTTTLSETPAQWFFPIAAGFTMEFIVVFVVARALTKRTDKTLRQLMQTNDRALSSNLELKDTQFKIIEFVSKCLGSHDLFTGHHVLHTRKYVELICNQLVKNGIYTDILDKETIALYSSAAFLHDIGKIHIPEGVLNKVGRFTDEEFELMKSHPIEGKKLLEFLPKIDDGRFNKIATEMTLYHHEKFCGTGYPYGIKGYEIPLCARIMAAADVLDALISKRLYKEPMDIDKALEIFTEERGKHFEECIADAVIQCRDQIAHIDAGFKAVEAEQDQKELDWWLKYHNMASQS